MVCCSFGASVAVGLFCGVIVFAEARDWTMDPTMLGTTLQASIILIALLEPGGMVVGQIKFDWLYSCSWMSSVISILGIKIVSAFFA